MSSSSSNIVPLPNTFTGENYQTWAFKMKTFLQGHGLWDVVEGKEVYVLPENPTVTQLKYHADETAKTYKALSVIQNNVSDIIFNKLMVCTTPKQAWDLLKAEFEGSEKSRALQKTNLRREFENIRMKDKETVRQYADRIVSIVNKIRMLGGDEEFTEKRMVRKLTDTLPALYEPKLSSLEDSRDLDETALSEVVNALHAFELRQQSRQEYFPEGAFHAKGKEKAQSSGKAKKVFGSKKDKAKKEENVSSEMEKKQKALCRHCKRPNHAEKDCWFRPDITCSVCNKKGHAERVCKNKKQMQQQQQSQAQVAEDSNLEEEQMFVATCFAGIVNRNKNEWLIDSGCTHHMVHDKSLFKTLNLSYNSKVRIGNGDYLEVKGK